jgi:hypothetical protein
MNKHIELARELRKRINHAYAAQRGTESYERRECAEAIEDLVQRLQAVEAQRDGLLGALESIQSRIRESAGLPVSDGDVFDSFYQDVIDEAIAKAQASEPAPKREWVGLTDADILEAAGIDGADTWIFETAYKLEAKLKELNHG